MLKEQIQQFREKNPRYRVLLGTVIGEFDRISKNPTDAECIAIIKKMIESNILTNQLEENEILLKFLPQQLTEEAIEEIIIVNNFENIGSCMKHFKSNFDGTYDGKLVSKIYNRIKNA